MIEGLAFIGAKATWDLQHSAMPGAPELPDTPRHSRRPILRPAMALALRRAAELLDPATGRGVAYR